MVNTMDLKWNNLIMENENLQNRLDQADEQIALLLNARKQDAHDIGHYKGLYINEKSMKDYWKGKSVMGVNDYSFDVHGFEGSVDILDQVGEAMEAITPNAEWTGTIRFHLRYIPEEKE